MARKRRRFTAEFKGRVALEALQERDSVQAIAARHELHPNQVSAWKRQLLDAAPEVFARGAARKLAQQHEAKIHDPHAKIGELTVERDFLSARVAALRMEAGVPAAAHQRCRLGAPDLSLPAARPRDLPGGPRLVCGHHLSRISQCAVERRAFLVGANPTQQLSLQLVAARAVHGGNDMD